MSKTFEIITTNMYAVCIIKGKIYEVKGHKLVEC